jgi:hypothetical protein
MEVWIFIQKTSRIDLCVLFATKVCKKNEPMGLAVHIPFRN